MGPWAHRPIGPWAHGAHGAHGRTLQKFPHGETTHKTNRFLWFCVRPVTQNAPPRPPLICRCPPRAPPRPPLKLRRPPPGPVWGSRTAETPPWDTFGPPTSGQVSQNKILLHTGTTASCFWAWPYFTILVAKNRGPSEPPQGPPERRDPFGTLPGAIWDPSGTFLDLFSRRGPR